VQLQLWIDAAAEACPVTRADAEERWRTLLASGQLGRVTVGAALLEERA
jgi:predicted secreted protein